MHDLKMHDREILFCCPAAACVLHGHLLRPLLALVCPIMLCRHLVKVGEQWGGA